MSLAVAAISSIFGFLGILVTTIAGVFIATRNRETEKKDSVLQALESTRDEIHEARLQLKEDTIAKLKEEIQRADTSYRAEIAKLEAENTSLRLQLQKNEDV